MASRKRPKLSLEVAEELMLLFLTEEFDSLQPGGFMQLDVVSRLLLSGGEFVEALHKYIDKFGRTVCLKDDCRMFVFNARKLPATYSELFALKFDFKTGNFFFNAGLRFARRLLFSQSEGIGEENTAILGTRQRRCEVLSLRDYPKLAPVFEIPFEARFLNLHLEEDTDEIFDMSKMKINCVTFYNTSKKGVLNMFEYLFDPVKQLKAAEIHLKGTHVMDVEMLESTLSDYKSTGRTNAAVEDVKLTVYWYLVKDAVADSDVDLLVAVAKHLCTVFPNLKKLDLFVSYEGSLQKPKQFVICKKSIFYWTIADIKFGFFPHRLNLSINFCHPDDAPYLVSPHMKQFLWKNNLLKNGESYSNELGGKFDMYVRFPPNSGLTANVVTKDDTKKNVVMVQVGDTYGGKTMKETIERMFTF